MRKITALFFAVLVCFSLSTKCFSVPKGAVLIDGENGRVFFEHNKDENMTDREILELLLKKTTTIEDDVTGLKCQVGEMKDEINGLKCETKNMSINIYI